MIDHRELGEMLFEKSECEPLVTDKLYPLFSQSEALAVAELRAPQFAVECSPGGDC